MDNMIHFWTMHSFQEVNNINKMINIGESLYLDILNKDLLSYLVFKQTRHCF